jgi:hypothetical protein
MDKPIRLPVEFDPKNKEHMKVYNKLRERAWKKVSKGMSHDVRSILFNHFFVNKEIN